MLFLGRPRCPESGGLVQSSHCTRTKGIFKTITIIGHKVAQSHDEIMGEGDREKVAAEYFNFRKPIWFYAWQVNHRGDSPL